MQKVNEAQRRQEGFVHTRRVVQDLRRFNAAVVQKTLEPQSAEDMKRSALGMKYFTIMDLKEAYFHMELNKEDWKELGIPYHGKTYCWTRLPMGYVNGPAQWTRAIEEGLTQPVQKLWENEMKRQGRDKEAKRKPIWVYIDDILLHTETEPDHLFLLKIVCETQVSLRLTVSIHKCEFAMDRVKILGSIVDGNQCTADAKRMEAILQIPPPKTIRELRAFRGSLQYIAQHIPKLAQLLGKFDEQTGNCPASKAETTPVIWNRDLLKDYNTIREHLKTNAKALVHFDPAKPIILETDASDKGFGAVLSHEINGELHPVAFYSKKWQTDAQKAYHATHKELYALYLTTAHFADYLEGAFFTIRADNQGVIRLLKRLADPKKAGKNPPDKYKLLTRWLIRLSGYNFVVQSASTDEVFTSDALSRSAAMDSAVLEEGERNVLSVNALEYQPLSDTGIIAKLLKHMRFDNCQESKQGFHPKDCLLLRVGTTQWERLKDIAQCDDRMMVKGDAIAVIAGHKQGIDTPRLMEMETPKETFYVTSRTKIPEIFRLGLQINRHKTSIKLYKNMPKKEGIVLKIHMGKLKCFGYGGDSEDVIVKQNIPPKSITLL